MSFCGTLRCDLFSLVSHFTLWRIAGIIISPEQEGRAIFDFSRGSLKGVCSRERVHENGGQKRQRIPYKIDCRNHLGSRIYTLYCA